MQRIGWDGGVEAEVAERVADNTEVVEVAEVVEVVTSKG